MAEYFYIENYNKRGKLAISHEAFDDIIYNVVSQIKCVSIKEIKKGVLNVHKPINTEIKNGLINSSVEIRVAPSLSEEEIKSVVFKIENEVSSIIEMMSEVDDFKLNVKVLGVDNNLK